ncbi:TetR/AcrR family transcriptional regulator [Rhodococcus sp. NBC_00294]|uniref:TetR/AcrR family transcriptional regulator n=1 Tax=Rhodococcus sp. NBC_00294 TaxID=2976004 RepID=UPI002E2AB6B1|nr:TetR/AcrR family transcriptional regulator [Rhodococcus sp. NBC_00294]
MAEPASRTYGGVDAADRAVRRRAALIEAGLDLMSSVGTDKTTMTAVCAAAGLTERYFYESFRTKSDLLLAVLDSVADEVRSAAIHAVSSTDGDVADRVRAALSAVVSIMLSDPRKGRIAFVESMASPTLRARRQATIDAVADVVVERSHELWADRALPPPQDRLMALMFIGACSELVSARLQDHIDATPDEIVDAATQLFLTGMLRPTS